MASCVFRPVPVSAATTSLHGKKKNTYQALSFQTATIFCR
jgi:hypothetical protein